MLDSHWLRSVCLFSATGFVGVKALNEILHVLSFVRYCLRIYQRHQEERLRELEEQMPEDVRQRLREGRAERERQLEERVQRRMRI